MLTENDWGQSVVERIFDRLMAFDSATTGAAQLVYKAHLRTYSIKGLRSVLGMGQNTAAYKGLMAHMDMIRQYQSIEGMTVMDAEDEFATHSYVRRPVRRSGAVRPAGRRRGRNSTGAPVRPVTGRILDR